MPRSWLWVRWSPIGSGHTRPASELHGRVAGHVERERPALAGVAHLVFHLVRLDWLSTEVASCTRAIAAMTGCADIKGNRPSLICARTLTQLIVEHWRPAWHRRPPVRTAV